MTSLVLALRPDLASITRLVRTERGSRGDNPPTSMALRGNLALAAASLGAALLAVEAGMRVAGVDPLADLRRGEKALLRPSADPEVEYELTPGARGRAWGTDVSVNSLGFRGPEVASTPGEAFRIVVLGDSVTFGASVPAGAEFPAQIGRLLPGGPSGYEVLNLAVGGYDTTNEAALLAARAPQLQPRLAIVAYCLNDIGVVSANLDYVRSLDRYRSPLYRSRLAAFVATRLDRSRVEELDRRYNEPAVFAERYRGRIDPIGADEAELRSLLARAPRPLPLRWYADDFRVGRVRHAFGRLAAVKQRDRLPVIVAILPWLEGAGGDYPYAAVHAIVAGEARRAGLEVLDLAPALAPHGLRSLRRAENPKDPCHPSARGHELIAEALAAHVLERYPR